MVQFSGTLASIDLPSLIKFLSDLHQTGTLELRKNGWSAQLGLRDGSVVASTFGTERGLPAIMAISVVMKEATFEYQEGPAPAEDEVDLTLEQLSNHLQPAAREASLALGAVPRRVPSPSGSSQADESILLTRATLKKLLAVDGQRTVGELVGSEPLAAGLRQLADLIDLGLISVDGPTRPTSRTRIDATQGGRRPIGGEPTSSGPLAERSIDAADSQTKAGSRQLAQRSNADEHADLACPRLGFADDPGSHFTRPTALHRCFASGSLKTVSTLEQRDLCLNGGYRACPRLRTALGLDANDAFPNSLRPTPRNHVPKLGPGLPAREGRPGPAPEAVLWTQPDAPDDANSPGGMDDHQPLQADDGPITARAEPVGLSSAPAGASVQGFAALLPFVAIALTIAAVLAWTYVLVLRPRLAERSAATAPSVVAETTPSIVAGSTPAAADQQPTIAPTTLPTSATITKPATSTPAALARLAVGNGPTARLIENSFSSSPEGWRINPPFASWSDGVYRLLSRVPGRFVAVAAPLQLPVSNATISATLRKLGGPSGGGYGLIVRDQDPTHRDGSNQAGSFYVLEVDDQGRVGMWRREDDHWIELLGWTQSDAVHSGTAANDLSVRTVGSQLTFIVNGTTVTTQNDATLGPGGVGVFVGGDLNEVAVDHFAVQPASD